MDTVIDLIKSSVITQFFITLMVLIMDCVMLIQGKTIPDQLWGLTVAVVVFYFGSKVGLYQGKSSNVPPQ
jgi:hypothetical protein